MNNSIWKLKSRMVTNTFIPNYSSSYENSLEDILIITINSAFSDARFRVHLDSDSDSRKKIKSLILIPEGFWNWNRASLSGFIYIPRSSPT